MSLEDKISRMDEILREIHFYRFHSSAEHFPYFKVKNLINTSVFQGHINQTKLAWMCFEFLLQGEYMMTYFGMMNRLVYDDNHHAHGWGLLRSHINYNALTQAVITGSRIQFEQLMNFIYYSFECKELGVDNKGSKISKFRNWLMMKGIMDDLFYLFPIIVACREHDDNFRSPEVHKGSKLKKDLFALNEPTNTNDIMVLCNYLQGFMESFLPLLDYTDIPHRI